MVNSDWASFDRRFEFLVPRLGQTLNPLVRCGIVVDQTSVLGVPCGLIRRLGVEVFLRELTGSPVPWIVSPAERFVSVGQFVGNEGFKSFKILVVQLYIIVSSSLNPQRFHSSGTTFVDCKTMREVNNLVLSAMDY